MRRKWLDQLMKINKELLLILSIMAFAGVINFFVTGQKLVLAFYDLPTLFAAYYFGRARAVQTALASILIVCWLNVLHPIVPASGTNFASRQLLAWSDIAIWGGFLLITAYAMGTLSWHNEKSRKELRDAHLAVLQVLNAFVPDDAQTQTHCYRTSIYSARIAEQIGLGAQRVEDVRAAAMLQDIGKLKAGRQILDQAAKLSEEEINEELSEMAQGAEKLKLASRMLRRIVPLIAGQPHAQDGTGSLKTNNEIPLELRIIRVAEAYDSLTTDWPYRKGMPPAEARGVIAKGAGKDFDAAVVAALESSLGAGRMQAPEVLV
jgi:HD-GYP domain-containing protein (c-di-GMP phosphodiesterase class II)